MQSCVDTSSYRLYEPGHRGGPRIVGLISRDKGERMVRNQTAETAVDWDGKTLCFLKKERNPLAVVAVKPQPAFTESDSAPSNTAFSQPEMLAIAGTNFKHGRSRTARLNEFQREARLARLRAAGRKAAPEDLVERATNKFTAWAQIKVLQDRVREVASL